MAKYYGKIGFGITTEVTPGVWKETITENNYYGDTIRNTRSLAATDSVNGNINVANLISIVSDPFANDNFHTIRYAEFMGTLWTITNVEVLYPRLMLTMGGVYNGKQA